MGEQTDAEPLLVRQHPDRRQPTREDDPPCPECANADCVTGAARSEVFVYFRCLNCDAVWRRAKPVLSQTIAMGPFAAADPRPN